MDFSEELQKWVYEVEDEVRFRELKAFESGRKAGLLEAAQLCEENNEVISTLKGERFIQKKTSNNINGNSYAEAIRALVDKEEKK